MLRIVENFGMLIQAMLLGATLSAVPVPPAEPAPVDVPPSTVETAPDSPAPAPPARVQERCQVVYSPAPGSVSRKVLESLHVADLGDGDAFVMPADAPDRVLAVECAREAILPQRNDYKVLLAGFPFMIVTKDRAAVLEKPPFGPLGLRTLKGKFTTEEEPLVRAYLDEAQYAMDVAKAAAAEAAATKKKKR